MLKFYSQHNEKFISKFKKNPKLLWFIFILLAMIALLFYFESEFRYITLIVGLGLFATVAVVIDGKEPM